MFWTIRQETIAQTTWPAWVVGIMLNDLSRSARHAIPNLSNRHLIRRRFSERMWPNQEVSIPHRLLQKS